MSIPKHYPFINVKGVTIRIWHNKKPIIKTITARQVARTIIVLVMNLENGVTSLELSNTFAVRTSEYIRVLRHDYNLQIKMVREKNLYSWHGRYFLQTPVDIVEIHYQDKGHTDGV